MTVDAPCLVVGAHGLLGHNLLQAMPTAIAPPEAIPWDDDPAPALAETAAWFVRRTGGAQWRVAWCAGAGVVGTSRDALDAETRALRLFLDALARANARRGMFFLASSAGGVHAGAQDDPVTERSPVAPLSAYGEAKLEQEVIVTQWATATGIRVAIGRFSNLYGPGQDHTKPQGLISSLVRASVRAEPLLVFVPLDTLRDYLFAPDAARLATALIDRVAEGNHNDEGPAVKIIASGRATTIGGIIAEIHRIRKKRPPVIYGMTAASPLQPKVLRFVSEVWPDLDREPTATLAEGIAAVVRDQLGFAATGASA